MYKDGLLVLYVHLLFNFTLTLILGVKPYCELSTYGVLQYFIEYYSCSKLQPYHLACVMEFVQA